MRTHLIATTLAAAAFVLPQTAAAQPGGYSPGYGEPRTGLSRDGFIIGFGIGGGHMEIDSESGDESSFDESVSLDFHAGGMLSPQFAIVGDLWGLAHVESESIGGADYDLTFTHTLVTAAGRYWFAPIFWAQAGVGFAQARASISGDGIEANSESEVAPGLMLAAGIEILQTTSFVLDAQLRYGAGYYGEDQNVSEDTTVHNLSLSAGFNWY